jgi:hypothetical protein
MTSEERVRRAIAFRQPDRVPVVFWNCDQTSGDIMHYHRSLGAPGDGTANAWDWKDNEWGYRLEKSGDGTMGHPVEPVYRGVPRPAEIYAEAQRLYDLLGTPAGGFIGYVEEASVMGMSAENYCARGEAFRRLRNQ